MTTTGVAWDLYNANCPNCRCVVSLRRVIFGRNGRDRRRASVLHFSGVCPGCRAYVALTCQPKRDEGKRTEGTTAEATVPFDREERNRDG